MRACRKKLASPHPTVPIVGGMGCGILDISGTVECGTAGMNSPCEE